MSRPTAGLIARRGDRTLQSRRPRRYALADVELSALGSVSLAEDQSGVALVVRRDGRVVGFVMADVGPGVHLDAAALSALVSAARAMATPGPGVEGGRPAEQGGGLGPAFTVAICTRSRTDSLAACLETLLSLRSGRLERSGAGFEILVVDNAPDGPATRDLVDALPGVRYTCEPVPGLDIARNRALRESQTEVIAYLDDDAEPDRWWCDALAAAWAEHPDASAITGLVLPLELDTEAQVLFELMGGFAEGWQTVRYSGPTHEGSALYPFAAGGFGAGCNMSFRRSAALAAGGFDEALDTGPPLPGGGDLDMLHRVVRRGGTLIYEPSIVVFHRHRRDRASLRRQYTSWGKSFMAFLAKCHGVDRAGRPAIRRTVRWWWRWQLGRLAGSLRRGSVVPPDLVVAELVGGAVGLMGEYGRSTRRIARRQRAAGQVTVAPRTGSRPARSLGS